MTSIFKKSRYASAFLLENIMFFLSLGIILLAGGLVGFLLQKIKLPALLGYLLLGILLGYFGLVDEGILAISSEIRKISLIIILLKAGLSLNLSDLKKVGRPAILMSFIPAGCEILAFILFGPCILKIT